MSEPTDILTELDVPAPMRDGVVLRANVFRPASGGPHPGLLLRTPYGKPTGGHDRYVRAGYAVVVQDSRGRYASDGEFKVFSEPWTHDGEDGYDSIEWLAGQPWCDGRVGTFGLSYNGWMQWAAARLRPPSLKAMAAGTIPTSLPTLDFPGAFRAARRVNWWMTTLAPDLRRRAGLPPPHTPLEAKAIWRDIEQGRWLGLLPWSDLPDFLPPPLAQQAADWLADPTRDPWRFNDAHAEIEVPNLDFSGWYDHCNDSIHHLPGMQANGRGAGKQSKLVLGPWRHGTFGQQTTCDVDFGPAAQFDTVGETIRWFDHWIKGEANGIEAEPAVRYLPVGTQTWRSAETWPPRSSKRTIHLSLRPGADARTPEGGGRLADSLGGANGRARYTYDPRDPLPTLWTPDLFTVPADRRRLEHRRDLLYFVSDPLEAPLTIAGDPVVVLHVATDAPDTDFFCWLVDDDPDGVALDIASGMVRLRHRHGLDRDEPVTPGETVEVTLRLGPTACCFAPGHRIRLEIGSSDFPNYDRNHNTGGNDLFETELRPAEQTVFVGPAAPSRVVLPVV